MSRLSGYYIIYLKFSEPIFAMYQREMLAHIRAPTTALQSHMDLHVCLTSVYSSVTDSHC